MKEIDIPIPDDIEEDVPKPEEEDCRFEPGSRMIWMGKKIVWPPMKLLGE